MLQFILVETDKRLLKRRCAWERWGRLMVPQERVFIDSGPRLDCITIPPWFWNIGGCLEMGRAPYVEGFSAAGLHPRSNDD